MMSNLPGFFANLEMGSSPVKGNVEIPEQIARELFVFIAQCRQLDPDVFERMGHHPAQSGYWLVNLAAALGLDADGKPLPEKVEETDET